MKRMMGCEMKLNLLLVIAVLSSSTIISAQKPHTSCGRRYRTAGCFAEGSSFQLLFTDTQLNGHVNESHSIGWSNWSTYMHSLACRCNQHASMNGFKYFALSNYGLCTGGNRISSSVSDRCLGLNGGIPAWNITIPCSQTCDNGQQMRIRNCTNPRPSEHGRDCSGLGPRTQVVTCINDPCQVDGGFSTWSEFGSCSKSCGGGIETRHRKCNNPKPQNGGKNCAGALSESRSCNNELCPDTVGISKAQDWMEKLLLGFFSSSHSKKSPSGKFRLAIFKIQQAVANELVFGTTRGSLDQRLDDLRKFLKVATEGGRVEFARSTLGKSLLTFMKKKLDEGLPYDGFQVAVNDHLKSIKSDIGEKKFNELMLVDGGATLVFAIDTTGSMKDEIRVAKGIANSVIRMPMKFPVDYILSPFNDPGHGPITYKNDSDKVDFLNAIDSLRVDGGRDCPELSFTGMLEAYRANPQLGSPMFVFTDASAKDDTAENMVKLKATASQYGSSINFFTNHIGCGGSNGIKVYKEIASYTSGQIFPLKNHGEVDAFTSYVAASLRHSLTIAKGNFKGAFGLERQRSTSTHDIYVEPGVEMLQVTVGVAARNAARFLVLNDPFAKAAMADTTAAYTRVYNIDSPAAGKWSLVAPSETGEGSFVAKAVGDAKIDFTAYFLHQERTGGPVISISNPVSGPKSALALRISGIEHVEQSSLRIAVIAEGGSLIQGGVVPTVIDASILHANINTPNKEFKILLSGKMQGYKFQRLSRSGFKASDVVLVTAKAGNEYTASVSKGRSSIEAYLYNGGATDHFYLFATASHGRITTINSRFVLGEGKNNTVVLDLIPPSESASLVGKEVRATLTSVRRTSGKRHLLEVKMMWVP